MYDKDNIPAKMTQYNYNHTTKHSQCENYEIGIEWTPNKLACLKCFSGFTFIRKANTTKLKSQGLWILELFILDVVNSRFKCIEFQCKVENCS